MTSYLHDPYVIRNSPKLNYKSSEIKFWNIWISLSLSLEYLLGTLEEETLEASTLTAFSVEYSPCCRTAFPKKYSVRDFPFFSGSPPSDSSAALHGVFPGVWLSSPALSHNFSSENLKSLSIFLSLLHSTSLSRMKTLSSSSIFLLRRFSHPWRRQFLVWM